jgi:bacteriocin-like protein
MANIKISELFPAGHDLFNDDSSFVNEINNQELNSIVGGGYYGRGRGRGHGYGYGDNDYYHGGNWF